MGPGTSRSAPPSLSMRLVLNLLAPVERTTARPSSLWMVASAGMGLVAEDLNRWRLALLFVPQWDVSPSLPGVSSMFFQVSGLTSGDATSHSV